jgi:hypothetical protein
MASSIRRLVPGVLSLLLVGAVLALAGCGSDESGASQREESIAEFVAGEDFGNGLGTPDAAECVASSDTQYECEVVFDQKALDFLATVRDDGRTVDLEMTPEQISICRAAASDARHLQRLARAPNAAGERISAYLRGGGEDPVELRRLFAESANAFRTYTSRLEAYRPGSEWAREAKPHLVAASEQGEQALRDVQEGDLEASRTLLQANEIFDEQLAKAPCPSVE